MKPRSSLFSAIVLGAGLCLIPLRAQDNPPNPPQKENPTAQQSWTGDLVDAVCKASTPSEKCEVSETTKAFGLQSADGTVYRFDVESNSKMMEALKNTDRRTGSIKVSVNGTVKEGMLSIASVQIR